MEGTPLLLRIQSHPLRRSIVNELCVIFGVFVPSLV